MKGKTWIIVVGVVALAFALGLAGVWATTAWAQGRWGGGMMSGYTSGSSAMGPGMMGYYSDGKYVGPSRGGSDWRGYGMMGSYSSDSGRLDDAWGGMPCGGGAYLIPGEGQIASLEGAKAAVESYVADLGYDGLEVTEVMEFEYNYYAIVAEKDSGVGALELLVDKTSGSVGLEPGPNMMWNAKYGMMGQRGGMMGMMGNYATAEMQLTPEKAEEVAQIWLDDNLPGRLAGEADPFYGYYTLHYVQDGIVDGMLSVHGSTGDVWYHSWHGDFIQMTEEHE